MLGDPFGLLGNLEHVEILGDVLGQGWQSSVERPLRRRRPSGHLASCWMPRWARVDRRPARWSRSVRHLDRFRGERDRCLVENAIGELGGPDQGEALVGPEGFAGPTGDVQQAALLRGVSVDTLRRRIRAGRLPAYRFGERLIKIRIEDFDNLFRPIPVGNPLRRRRAS